MTRKEILALPVRKMSVEESNRPIAGVCGMWLVPTRKKHSSGWMCMQVIVTFKDGRDPVTLSSTVDDIQFTGAHFRLDCDYPSGIVHIWNGGRANTFGVREGWCSSIDLEEEV